VRVPVPELVSGEVELDAEASRYLARVLRLRAGASFVAFDPARALEADAAVVREGRGKVLVQIGPLRPGRVVARRPVVWLQGLAKADKLDAIVRDATELGATRVAPFVSRFGVVKLDEGRAADKHARWERIAHEAARQCGRADAPAIDAPTDLASALATVPGDHARFLLYERAETPIGPALREAIDARRPLAFAAGPEGGFAEDECEAARAGGWALVSLGEFVLRTETVAAAVLGAVCIGSQKGG
jgi:16S rRNA (uracil1498-N3)-methyltransferase